MLNDSYRTDVCLLHAPYVVAIGCMGVAAALTERDLQPWLAGLTCDLNEVTVRAACYAPCLPLYALRAHEHMGFTHPAEHRPCWDAASRVRGRLQNCQ